jgi:septal ring factor EnvC (AmiA/AmiB activator)
VSWPSATWGFGGLLVAADQVAASETLTTVLIALLGTTTAGALVAWFRGRNKDKVDITAAVASVNETSLKVMGDSMQMVRQVQEQLEQVRREQADTARRLAAATERIAHLEGELRTAREDRDKLLHELIDATQERDGLKAQMSSLSEQVATMERAVRRSGPALGP